MTFDGKTIFQFLSFTNGGSAAVGVKMGMNFNEKSLQWIWPQGQAARSEGIVRGYGGYLIMWWMKCPNVYYCCVQRRTAHCKLCEDLVGITC